MMFSLFFPVIAINKVCMAEIIISESITASPNGRYIVSSPSLTIIALPPSSICCPGDTLSVEDIGPGGFRISQQSNQQIQAGDEMTSIGLGGKIDTIGEGTTIQLSYAGDGGWIVDWVTQNIYFE
jgi:hypothetical protein